MNSNRAPLAKNDSNDHLKADGPASKAALYYLIAQVLIRSTSFLITPILARIMTTAEYGTVSNLIALESVLLPLLTLNVRVSINKSKYDHREDNDSYIATITCLSCVLILLFSLFVEMNREFFCEVFSADIKDIRLLLLYVLFYSVFDLQQVQHRVFGKYKSFVAYSIFSSIASLLLSVLLVFLIDDKVFGRMIGLVAPMGIISAIIAMNMIKRHAIPKARYIRYALSMSIPLLPSAFSATLLSASSKIIISFFCGSDQTALYAIPYTVASVAAILWTALNQAWGPWFYDNLNAEKYDVVRLRSTQFGYFYILIICGLMLFAPEILWILGGDQYTSAIVAIPPVILAMVFQFYYSFYFNTEYFYGETYIISLGTMLAAIINIVLSIMLVPQYGYIAAAYATLVGYAVMALYHYLIVWIKLRKHSLFDNRAFLLQIAIAIIVQCGAALLYSHVIARYLLIGAYAIIIAIGVVRHRERIQRMIM